MSSDLGLAGLLGDVSPHWKSPASVEMCPCHMYFSDSDSKRWRVCTCGSKSPVSDSSVQPHDTTKQHQHCCGSCGRGRERAVAENYPPEGQETLRHSENSDLPRFDRLRNTYCRRTRCSAPPIHGGDSQERLSYRILCIDRQEAEEEDAV